MSIGTLFITPSKKTRTIVPERLVKNFKLDIKIAGTDSEEFTKNFPLKKVPTFIGADGLVLTEVIAISLYFLSLVPESSLLGKTKEDYALILRWLSYGNSEISPSSAGAWTRLNGLKPYNKKMVEDSLVEYEEKVAVVENELKLKTYLVGERPTLADFFLATYFWRPFCFLNGKEWREAHPNVTRWWSTIIKNPFFGDAFDDFTFIDKQIDPVLPKKEKKEKKETPAAAPKAAPAAAASDEIPAEKKVVHPLAALGAAKSFAIDEWKRVYSNKETREEALPWFWEHFDASEWSLYKVAYKYNDELTLTFMSNNLVGGFFNRLSASTKYLFGCMVVYGENNNNGIVGVFLVRGQDYVPAFDVAPDWESYEFSKLDPVKDKEYVNDLWAWDKPLEIEGEKKEIADGKVFK